MTTDSQTQEIPRVPKAVPAVEDAEVAAPDDEAEVAAPDDEAEVAAPDNEGNRTESVQDMYESGMAKLDALYDHWAAAMAEIQKVQTSVESREAAA